MNSAGFDHKEVSTGAHFTTYFLAERPVLTLEFKFAEQSLRACPDDIIELAVKI